MYIEIGIKLHKYQHNIIYIYIPYRHDNLFNGTNQTHHLSTAHETFLRRRLGVENPYGFLRKMIYQWWKIHENSTSTLW